MSALGRYSKLIEVAGGGWYITIQDSIQTTSFYDLNVLVYPLAVFTGSVEFYIGKFLAATVSYTAEEKLAVFTPSPPSYPEIFPATVIKSVHELESGVTGYELLVSVKVINNGVGTVSVKIHFMRKFK